MANKSDFQKAAELISKSTSALITTHIRPDGDSAGCVAAMSQVLKNLGKKANPIFLSPLPAWYEFLFEGKVPVLGNDIKVEQLKEGQFGQCDLVIIVDTNSYSQLPNFEQYLKQNHKPVLVVDHHVTTDGLGDVELVDTTAAATGQIILELLRYANWPITGKIAEALFVATATDTGWFKFSNTDSRVFEDASKLIAAGANPAESYNMLYQNFSLGRLKLMVRMLNTLELHFEGQFATQYILEEDFIETGSKPTDTENLIDECRRIGTVKAAALFVELPDGRIRCSLRSKEFVDVRRIAQKFGGGGHTMAAGAYLPGPLKSAMELIKTEAGKQFGHSDR